MQHTQIEKQADILFENYPFEVQLHYMSGWHLKNNQLTRDIHIGIPGDDTFIAAQFFINLDHELAIKSYGGYHPKIHIGKTIVH